MASDKMMRGFLFEGRLFSKADRLCSFTSRVKRAAYGRMDDGGDLSLKLIGGSPFRVGLQDRRIESFCIRMIGRISDSVSSAELH